MPGALAYSFPPGKVVQAAGRVIRREDDRGVIVLVDQRFMQRDYALFRLTGTRSSAITQRN